MNKTELIATIAERVDCTKDMAEKVINGFTEVVGETLQGGEDNVIITNFGTFKSNYSQPREGVDPRNPETKMQIPGGYRVSFSAGKGLKTAVNAESKPAKKASKTAVKNEINKKDKVVKAAAKEEKKAAPAKKVIKKK